MSVGIIFFHDFGTLHSAVGPIQNYMISFTDDTKRVGKNFVKRVIHAKPCCWAFGPVI